MYYPGNRAACLINLIRRMVKRLADPDIGRLFGVTFCAEKGTFGTFIR